jgi:hypothetical protein
MKFIYYLFYRIYSLYAKIHDDSLREFKPLITIIFFEGLLLYGCLSCYSIITQTNNYFTEINEVLFIAALLIINYLIFIKNGKWKKYLSEFESYTNLQKKLRDGIGILIGIILFSFFMISTEILHNKVFFRPLR